MTDDEVTGGDETIDAPADALARARRAARERGVRPGSPAPRRRRIAGAAAYSGPGRDARDPGLIGEEIDRLIADRGWDGELAMGAVMGRWPHVVGPTIAQHVTAVGFTDATLTVQADSTAWATQMRLLTPRILGRLADVAGPDIVTGLVVLGPTAPTWSRGRRRVPGRGPRDTYG